MATSAPIPLSAPRPPGPDEARHCRNQADLFNALGPDPLHRVVLLPACMFCGSDQLHVSRMDCTSTCGHCGKANATDVLHAGRLATR